MAQQQQRTQQYRQHLLQLWINSSSSGTPCSASTALLQQQNRSSQYRYQTEYVQRMRQQQVGYARDANYDYGL